MRWQRVIDFLLRRPRHQPSDDHRDLHDEIAFHLDEETRLRVERGQRSDDARRSAARDFGNVPLIEEVTRSMWAWTSRERLARDFRFALRTLTRDASFSIVALVTLALGIGATISVFAIVNSVLLRPLPFPEPDRLVMVWGERAPDGASRNMVNIPTYVEWRPRNHAFDQIGLVSSIPFNISGRGEAEQVDGLRVTAEVLSALGVAPLMGRRIEAGEDVIGGFRSTVLTYQFWQRHYGGSPAALGQILTINGVAHEIVGIMPASFYLPGIKAELFIPLQIDYSTLPRGRSMLSVARLKSGVSVPVAQADMDRVAAEISNERQQLNGGYGATVVPLIEQAVGSTERILWVLFGSVSCLLLLACANVANLLLMRATTRAPEMAVRMALGAGRWRLIHQLIVESLVLTIAAAALGLLVAWTIVPVVPNLFPSSFPLPRGNEVSLDHTVVLFTLVVCVIVGIVFGTVPAMHVSASSLTDPIRNSGRTVVGTHARVRRGLVVVEVALAVVLVFGAGLMSQSLMQLYQVNPGFDAGSVLSMRMLLIPSKYRSPEQRVAFLGDVLDRIRSKPGVSSASSIHFLPLTGVGSSTSYFRADRPAPPRDALEGVGGGVSIVTADYFKTMGIPLLQGRDFNERDRIDSQRVVIVNETLAKRWFPEGSPVGKHISLAWSVPAAVSFEIIGVAGDVRAISIETPPAPAIYLAQTQEPSAIATLVLRAAGSPGLLTPSVRAAIAEVDPTQGVSEVQSLDVLIANSTARPQVQAIVLGIFAFLALLIASIGLYGVMSYSVEQRRREMGLRVALGAAPADLLRHVVKEGLVLAAVGISLGALLGIGASASLSGLLYETQPTSPRVVIAVGSTLLIVAAIASIIPARRATRVDPMIVLRDQ